MPDRPSLDASGFTERQSNEQRCYCDACKAQRFEPNNIKTGVVHDWDYSPRRLTHRRVKGDSFPYSFGIELETSENYSDMMNVLSQSQAVDLRRPKNLWYAKYDSSVSGPEFVSYPATLTYWKAQAPKLSEMFSLLVHAGYRSHNGGRAGMHVNIDKSAFENAVHLHRFLTFLWAELEWSTVVSQRLSNHLDRWARPYPYSPELARKMLGRQDSWYGSATDKYSLVHAPAGQDRLEFRMPRGTLRLDRFYKNLEWTAALIAYTRQQEPPTLSAKAFTEWALERRGVYENFAHFLEERADELGRVRLDYPSSGRFTDCAYTPTPLRTDVPDITPPPPSQDDDLGLCPCEICVEERQRREARERRPLSSNIVFDGIGSSTIIDY